MKVLREIAEFASMTLWAALSPTLADHSMPENRLQKLTTGLETMLSRSSTAKKGGALTLKVLKDGAWHRFCLLPQWTTSSCVRPVEDAVAS